LNKPLIFYNLDELAGIVDEVVLIVGYRKEMLRTIVGDQYRGMRIIYQEQKEQLGTGHAVLQARPHIRDRFIVMNGDDLFAGSDIQKLTAHPYSALAMEVDDPSQYGVIVTDENDHLMEFVEKPKVFVSRLTNVGCYVMEPDIFSTLEELPLSERGEIELPSAILAVAGTEPVKVVRLRGYWLPTGFPWDLLKTQRYLFDHHFKSRILGKLNAGAVCTGRVVIEEGSVVKRNAIIEGPVHIARNSSIGEGSVVGPYTSIGANVIIGKNTHLSGSLVMDGCEIGNDANVDHSVLGENLRIGDSLHVSSVLSDELNITSFVKGKHVDTGLKRLGAIIADNAVIGDTCKILPGCKIWPGLVVNAGSTVREDLPE
jgi:bifunctional UDP-N-acetylglucosamine pyrophosphorylase/glucosamine-1-phosphate N-acetyltransferase